MRDEDEPLAMDLILGTPPAPADGTGDLKTLSRILGVAGSVIPVVSAGSVLLDWAIEKRQPTIKETLGYWDGVLSRFEDRLDEKYLQSKDGVVYVETVLAAGARAAEERKRELYAGALVNGLAKERLYDTEGQLRLVDTLARLRPAHLLLFASARGPRTGDDFATPLGGIVDLVWSDPVFISQLRPGVPAEVLRIDWGDLQRAGLVEDEPITGSPYSGYQAFITEYGFRFDSFVRVPYDDVHPRADSPQSASAPPSPEG